MKEILSMGGAMLVWGAGFALVGGVAVGAVALVSAAVPAAGAVIVVGVLTTSVVAGLATAASRKL